MTTINPESESAHKREPYSQHSQHSRMYGRRITKDHINAMHNAQCFTGLPDDVSRFHLIRLLKSCGKRLGFTSALIRHLEAMVSFTNETDWHGDNPFPFVFLAVDDNKRENPLTKVLGVSRQQTNRIERKLVTLGALVHHDSGNLQRYRNMFDSYGLDLRPLGTMYPLLLKTEQQQRKDNNERKKLCQRIGSLRRKITGLVYGGHAQNDVLDDPAITSRIRASTPIALLKQLFKALQTLLKKYIKSNATSSSKQPKPQKRLHQRHQKVTQATPKGVTQLYYKESINKSYKDMTLRRHEVGISDQTTQEEIQQPSGMGKNPANALSSHGPSKSPPTSDSLAWWKAITPVSMRSHLEDIKHPSDIVTLVENLRSRAGVSSHAWRSTVQIMGRDMAAQCLLVAMNKFEQGAVSTVGGYLVGMSRKYRSGQLDVTGSIRALVTTQKEKSQQPPWHDDHRINHMGAIADRVVSRIKKVPQ